MVAIGTCAAFAERYIPGARAPLPVSRDPQEAAHAMALYSSEETETRGGERTCPRTHGREVAEPGCEPARAGPRGPRPHLGRPPELS